MRRLYSLQCLFCFVLLVAITGCHQDPVIPESIIPGTCQVYRIATIDENVRDTTTCIYDTFGQVKEVTYRQWTNGMLTTNSRQSFTYSVDRYLMARTDQTTSYGTGGTAIQNNKGYTYTYQDGYIQQVTVNNALSGQLVGYNRYIYENGKLKTYAELNAQQQPVRAYTLDNNGKLTQLTEAGTTSAVVTNGKITTRILSSGTTVSYQFDGQGQLIGSDSTVAPNNQTKRTYTYDNNPFWTKTQLLFRGIPTPDLGGHTSVHNLLSSTIVQTQNSRVVQNQKFDYQRTYTKAGYTLGYSRNDGAKQRIVYANCL